MHYVSLKSHLLEFSNISPQNTVNLSKNNIISEDCFKTISLIKNFFYFGLLIP